VDKAWLDDVVRHLGARYKTGAPSGEAVELLYRAGRAEFRSSRFMIGGGASGRELELLVDVRVPKEAPADEASKLIEAFEKQSALQRGFVRVGEDVQTMKTETGAESGTARSLRYQHGPCDAAEAAKQIRAFVESIDIPFTVGIHEPEHLIARDPPPPRAKPKRTEPMDLWEYQLDGGLFHSLKVVVDPNDRTLRVMERRMLSTRRLGETVKLALVAALAIRKKNGHAELVAIQRDGTELMLAVGSGNPDFVATAGRLAEKVRIPFEER
jgi:hypothetical protein